MENTIPVLLVEDNRILREALASILDEQPDLRTVAAVACANGALLRLRETNPRVVLVNATLGDRDSCPLVETVRTAALEARVVVTDVLPVPDLVVQFVRAGACGFVAKDATAAELVSTVRAVAEGTDVLPLSFTGTLFSHIAKQALHPGAPEPAEPAGMTKREREVSRLLAEGMSNKEIAQRLHVSTNTVKGHVHNILEKLSLHSRGQVAAQARSGTFHPRSAT